VADKKKDKKPKPKPKATTTTTQTTVPKKRHPEAQALVDAGIHPDRVHQLTQQHAPNHPAAGDTAPKGAGGANPLAKLAAGVDSFLGAVKTHESSGNYQADSGDGAYGAYQYIPSTWNSVATAAGYPQYANGRADLAPPAVQDAVARYDASKKFQEYKGNYNDMAQAWFDPAYVGQSNYAPPGNNGLTMGEYGAQITKLMGQGAGQGTSVVSPVGPGLTEGRTDQGVDWSGKGPLYATGAGTIESVSNAGWPGGAYIDLRLANPPDPSHSDVYYAEDINPDVKVGEQVSAGQQVGEATGGSSGIELGWGNPAAVGQPLNQALSGAYAGSGATPQGQSFLDYIGGGSAGGTASGSTDSGAQALSSAAGSNLFGNLPNLGGTPATTTQSLQSALAGLSSNAEQQTLAANTSNAPGSPDRPASATQQTNVNPASQYQALLAALLPGIAPGSAGKNG
jgi:hypothetical protein